MHAYCNIKYIHRCNSTWRFPLLYGTEELFLIVVVSLAQYYCIQAHQNYANHINIYNQFIAELQCTQNYAIRMIFISIECICEVPTRNVGNAEWKLRCFPLLKRFLFLFYFDDACIGCIWCVIFLLAQFNKKNGSVNLQRVFFPNIWNIYSLTLCHGFITLNDSSMFENT